jgi:hypothetical protein
MMPALIPMRGQAGPQITLAATSTATSATAPATAPRHGTRRGRRRGQRSASAAVPSSPRASARSTHAPDRPCPSRLTQSTARPAIACGVGFVAAPVAWRAAR